MIPQWLHLLSIAALAIGAVSATAVGIDVWRHPQKMSIMNIVWPVVALFGTGLTAYAYLRYGRRSAREAADEAPKPPFAVMVAKGALHCGSGCTLGDIVAEWTALLAPGVAIWFGWGSLFGNKLFAVWILDYILAFLLGIVFQYFTIAPMRGLGLGAGIWAAVKADALSLTAWQVGMYAFMAFANLVLFRSLLGVRLVANMPEFWFMMQLAMICGFATSYPVNWLLLRAGIKERM